MLCVKRRGWRDQGHVASDPRYARAISAHVCGEWMRSMTRTGAASRSDARREGQQNRALGLAQKLDGGPRCER